MDFKLSQKQTQKLKLSPQIRQYIKLLALPLLELRTAIEQQVSANPVLEEAENQDISVEDQSEEEKTDTEREEELDFEEKFEELSKLDDEFKQEIYSSYERSRDRAKDLQKSKDYRESLITNPPTLADYLLWQLDFLDITDKEIEIAEQIIGNTNNEGYLKADINDIASAVSASREDVEWVLSQIQNFDPPGICARNLTECLCIQLRKIDKDTHLAQDIVKNHLKLLKKRDYEEIARLTKTSKGRVEEACELIHRLEPKPGRIFFQDEAVAIVPDASIIPNENEDTGYSIELHNEYIPRFRISRMYRKMMKDKSLDKKTREYIKEKINAGIWLIRAIDQRKTTLRQITEEIVKVQREFFGKGFNHLKPLRLKDIAKKVGIHESTVSRAIANKYVSTPQGTIPYKSFFSTKMETESGIPTSQKSIMEKIRELITTEPPEKPLSDDKIVKILRSKGIKIARRTVAKYRKLMKILPSHLRKNR